MTPQVEREASPDQEVGFTMTALFRGAGLSEAQRTAAEDIVRAEVFARRVARPPGVDGWALALEAMARRDEALRALLSAEAQRAAFDANAASQRRMLEEVVRSAKRCDVGEEPPAV